MHGGFAGGFGGGPCGRRGRGYGGAWEFGPGVWAGLWGAGPGAGAGRGRGRGSRRGRLFDPGDLKFVVLGLLEEKPRHGYDVIKELEERLDGAYSPSPGSVYPTLSMLEDLGFARAREEEGGRKIYEITDAGRAHLEENRATVDAIFARLEGLGEDLGAAPMVELGRTFGDLGRAAFRSAARAPGDAARLRALREILERARREIEAL